MNILQYNHLDYSRVKERYKKVITMLKNDDFYSADVKKIANTPYYRAKLDHANRLLFKIVNYNNKKYALILEVIYNHAYEASKFLNGAQVNESQVVKPGSLKNETAETITYINENVRSFNILDKIISFDDAQYDIFMLHFPLIIIGSAGSGKTVLTLEKMKECYGDILYITHSPFLVENSRNLYYANQYNNEDQNIGFLSYRELLETVKVPDGKEVNSKIFSAWLAGQNRTKLFSDANKLYEEFKGVITGSIINQRYLLRDEYTNLGIKQSIFRLEERPLVYDLFEKYVKFLTTEKLYDSNIISFEHLNLCQPRYDFIIVDEIQDFTNIQLCFILKALKNKNQFILSGDSNQIVHPNFFSWSKVKTMFYQESQNTPADIIRILYKNYRNSPQITEIANNILRLKNLRFGSIDKESNYLIENHSAKAGTITCLASNNNEILSDLNKKTKKSTKYAIIVLHEDLKNEARKHFQTPLIFSIQEAKGLEYKNVILFNFISCEEKKYYEIAKGISSEELTQDLIYSRTKDKSDRSLEIYKFYINSLYVAITRAIDNIYIVEDYAKHALIELLGLKNSSSNITLIDEESSLEEWRQEAHKLDLQGKTEQADEIRNSILAQKQTPWKPIDKAQFEMLKSQAFDAAEPNKNAMLLLFEYAVIYNQAQIIEQLKTLNFKPAQHAIDQTKRIIEKKYFLFYGSHNISAAIRDIDTYGIDFRNQFNQTPLMVASNLGNVSLAQHLVENGADIFLVDNVGRTALQIVLLLSYFDNKYAQTKLAQLYKLLAPSSISIKVEDKLIKVDNRLMEFFLFNLISAISNNKFAGKYFYFDPGFCTGDFLKPLEKFPESVLLERRKKRSYISSILSKNEVSRDDRYNRKLFLRTHHGFYILNPKLEVKMQDAWFPLYKLMELDVNELLEKSIWKIDINKLVNEPKMMGELKEQDLSNEEDSD
jgi:hypothetical protein